MSLSGSAPFYIVHSPLHLTLLYVQEHLQWDSKCGLAGVVSGHTGLITPPDVIFMFGSCTGGENGYFPKCLLLISADEKSRLWRECGVTCQSKPTETWWVSHCRGSGDPLAVHWNSSDIGTWLAAHCWACFQTDYSFLHNQRLALICTIAIVPYINSYITP